MKIYDKKVIPPEKNPSQRIKIPILPDVVFSNIFSYLKMEELHTARQVRRRKTRLFFNSFIFVFVNIFFFIV